MQPASLPYPATTAGRALKSAFATPASFQFLLLPLLLHLLYLLLLLLPPAPASPSCSCFYLLLLFLPPTPATSAHRLILLTFLPLPLPLPLALALAFVCTGYGGQQRTHCRTCAPCLSSIIVACFGSLLLLLCCRFWPHVARFTASLPFVIVVLLVLLVATQISLSVCTPAQVASFVVCFCFPYQQQQANLHEKKPSQYLSDCNAMIQLPQLHQFL